MKSVVHTLLRGARGRMAVRSSGVVPGQGAQCCSRKLKKSRGGAAAVSAGKEWK